MNYNQHLQLMLDAALDIKAGNFDKKFGICGNIASKVTNVIGDEQITMNPWRILKQAFYTWPKFSGDANFPINDPYNRDPDPRRAYDYSHKWTGAYGALRFELLDHVIDFLKNEIEKE